MTGVDFWLALTIMLGVAAGIPLGLALNSLEKAITNAIFWRLTR